MSDGARVIPETVRISSEGETLQADLYGALPSRRATILVHGQQWDASGWRDVASRLVARGVTALALNLRGYDGSTGKTNRWSSGSSRDEFLAGEPWSPVADLRAAKALLRDRGAREIALVGASMGGHAILASSFEADVESIVSVSAPVTAVPDGCSDVAGVCSCTRTPARRAAARSPAASLPGSSVAAPVRCQSAPRAWTCASS